MLLLRLKRKFALLRYRARTRAVSRRKAAVLIAALFLLLGLLLILLVRFRPVLIQIATSATGDTVTKMINDSVAGAMADGNIGYDDLVTLKKDSSGSITALVTNMAEINRLQARISNAILARLYEEDTEIVSVPLGNVLGGMLLSGRGPKIPVKVVSLSSVYTSFRNDFSAAGINQTRHQIMLDIDVELDILVPGSTAPVAVSDEIVIAETVIVGDVPGAYADMQQGEIT